MLHMKKAVFFIVALFLISFVSAPFGYDNLNLPQLREELFGDKPPGYYMPNNKSVFGNFSFNGGWGSGGFSIIDGDIYAQTGYFYNITSLNVTRQDLTIIENLDVFGNLTVDTNTLFVDSNSNRVGIGTASPSTALDVRGANDSLHIGTGTAIGDKSWMRVGGRALFGYNGARLNAVVQGMGSKGIDFNVNSNTFGDGTAMTIDINGKVGIGTTSPNVELDIEGAGSTSARIKDTDSTGELDLTASGLDAYVSNIGADGKLFFRTGGFNNRMVIDKDGKVGIGTTEPGKQLHIKDTGGPAEFLLESTYNDASLYLDKNETSDHALIVIRTSEVNKFGLGTRDNDNFIIRDYTNNVNPVTIEAGASIGDSLYIKSDGKVGIGTTSPLFKLDISESTGANIRIGRAEAGSTITAGEMLGRIGFGGLAGSNDKPGAYIQAYADVNWSGADEDNAGTVLGFYTQDDSNSNTLGTPRMVIDKDGNVGIGTTTPQNTLNVVGDLNVTGRIYNSLAHAFGLATAVHTVAVADTWYNITMNRSHADASGFAFSPDNITMIVPHDGHYTITFGMGIIDSAALPDADVGMRVEVNGAELKGSYIEDDTQKKDSDKWQEHTTHTELSEGDLVRLQYISSVTTVTIAQEDTYATQGFSAFGYIQEVMV